MGAVQWLASGNPIAQHDLLKALRNGNANPIMMSNLINGYLQDLGQIKLAETIQKDWTVPKHMEVMNDIPITD